MVMVIEGKSNLGKILSCNLMNTNEEIECDVCKIKLLIRELYVEIDSRKFDEQRGCETKRCCVDCAEKVIVNSIGDIKKWSEKQISKLQNWRSSYIRYITSDTYNKIKLAKAISKEDKNDN